MEKKEKLLPQLLAYAGKKKILTWHNVSKSQRIGQDSDCYRQGR